MMKLLPNIFFINFDFDEININIGWVDYIHKIIQESNTNYHTHFFIKLYFVFNSLMFYNYVIKYF